jgi:hypothetical protein
MIAHSGPHLDFTYNAEKHEYRLDGQLLPHPTGVLAKYNDVGIILSFILAKAKAGGDAVHGQLLSFLKEWEELNDEKLNIIPAQTMINATELGKSVHLYCAAYNNCTLDMTAELPKVEGEYDMAAIINGWDRVYRDNMYVMTAVERQMYSRKYLYGCTVDAIAGNIVMDFKPMSAKNKRQVGAQLAANAMASFEEGGFLDANEDGTPATDRWKLISWHYDAWGKWEMKTWPFKESWNAWMCALTAHNHFGGKK